MSICACGCRQPITRTNSGNDPAWIIGHHDVVALRQRTGEIDARRGNPPRSMNPDYLLGYAFTPAVGG